jgi:asparagine synthase (glutamine-hydrolysing)
MRRLAIIDLATGNQPIANETEDVWVVFNGEIYNYQELHTALVKQGHIFSTNSDTETIVHLYEDYGLDFVQHLRGMFAIAIWDVKKQNLILARDRIGEKPLFYSYSKGQLLFGSEIKAVLQGMKSREVNHQAVCDFVCAGYVADSGTFYRDIKKIKPGHLLVCDRNGISIQQYWRFDPSHKIQLPYRDACHELETRLVESIYLCLKSDVEVGAFLSGGIDSSLIVALMRAQGIQVQTFSVGYGADVAGFNELSYAKQVADHLNTTHHELILGPQSSMELLPNILWHYDEPHGEPTSVLVYHLCKFTRQNLKVALGGTGGDELFFGYPRHAGLRYLEWYRLAPKVIRKNLIERIVNAWPESTRGNRFAKRVKRFVAGADQPPCDAYMTWVSLIHPEIRKQLLSAETMKNAADPAGDQFMKSWLTDTKLKGVSPLDRAAALDITGYLPEYQLTYMDRMSMAHSLEVRSPLCDYKLVEFSTSLPTKYRLKGSRSKHILKDVALKWLPANIVNRRKVGFDSPIGQWFKTNLREFIQRFLSPEHIARSGLLNPQQVQKLVNEHLTGRRDYSLQLWSIVALEGWYRMYIEDRISTLGQYSMEDLRCANEH